MRTLPVPAVSDAARSYLARVWWGQPTGAAANDLAYQEWEAAFDRLCADADAGIPAALEAVEVIDAEVTETIRRLREERP